MIRYRPMKKLVLPLLALLAPAVPAPDAPPKPWEQVVVIGASTSAGFGTAAEVKGRAEDVAISDLCEAMILKKHQPVRNLADKMFFTDPKGTAGAQVEAALKAEPSALLAVDFLFWFVYGSKSDEERASDLEEGLALLEKFSCPVLIGGFPDMTDAVGKVLQPGQVPDPEVLKKLNNRVVAWSQTHKNVTLIPMCRMHADLRAGKGVKSGKCEWKPHSVDALLQKDRLHPTVEGLALLTAMCLESLQKREKAAAGVFDLDAKSLAARLRKGTGK